MTGAWYFERTFNLLPTGRKPVHTGINFWIPQIAIGLGLNETTLAQVSALSPRGADQFVGHERTWICKPRHRKMAFGDVESFIMDLMLDQGFFKTAYTPTFRGYAACVRG